MHRMEEFLEYCRDVKAKPSHISVYAYILSQTHDDVAVVSTPKAMEYARISSRKTYYNVLSDLTHWGWLTKESNEGKSYIYKILHGDDNTRFVKEESKTSAVAIDDDFSKFELIFDLWAAHATDKDNNYSRAWMDAMTKETGIVNFDLAMELYKTHIIKLAKVKDWLAMTPSEKKSYFLFASKIFATRDCKITKAPVAMMIVDGDKTWIQYETLGD